MRSRLFLGLLFAGIALAGPVCARGTLDSILPEIRAAHPGRLSDAEPWTDSEGRTHYKIKWMTPEGRILYFNADADSGHYSSGGDDSGQWRDHGGRGRGDDDDAPPPRDSDGARTHWNGDGGDGNTDGNTGVIREWAPPSGSDDRYRYRSNPRLPPVDWHGGRNHGDNRNGGDNGGWRHVPHDGN